MLHERIAFDVVFQRVVADGNDGDDFGGIEQHLRRTRQRNRVARISARRAFHQNCAAEADLVDGIAIVRHLHHPALLEQHGLIDDVVDEVARLDIAESVGPAGRCQRCLRQFLTARQAGLLLEEVGEISELCAAAAVVSNLHAAASCRFVDLA